MPWPTTPLVTAALTISPMLSVSSSLVHVLGQDLGVSVFWVACGSDLSASLRIAANDADSLSLSLARVGLSRFGCGEAEGVSEEEMKGGRVVEKLTLSFSCFLFLFYLFCLQ